MSSAFDTAISRHWRAFGREEACCICRAQVCAPDVHCLVNCREEGQLIQTAVLEHREKVVMCGSEVPVSKPCSVMPNSCATLNMDGAHEQPCINGKCCQVMQPPARAMADTGQAGCVQYLPSFRHLLSRNHGMQSSNLGLGDW